MCLLIIWQVPRLLSHPTLEDADSAYPARIWLNKLATYGPLDPADLARFGPLANLDDHDRVLFTPSNTAAVCDLDAAITLLEPQRSPAAGETRIEVMRDAGRFDEALAACDALWTAYRALKTLQEKVNILALHGDIDAAEACAAQLLATGELATEQRRQLHRRLIERRVQRPARPGP
jgi:hypothetical protein